MVRGPGRGTYVPLLCGFENLPAWCHHMSEAIKKRDVIFIWRLIISIYCCTTWQCTSRVRIQIYYYTSGRILQGYSRARFIRTESDTVEKTYMYSYYLFCKNAPRYTILLCTCRFAFSAAKYHNALVSITCSCKRALSLRQQWSVLNRAYASL